MTVATTASTRTARSTSRSQHIHGPLVDPNADSGKGRKRSTVSGFDVAFQVEPGAMAGAGKLPLILDEVEQAAHVRANARNRPDRIPFAYKEGRHGSGLDRDDLVRREVDQLANREPIPTLEPDIGGRRGRGMGCRAGRSHAPRDADARRRNRSPTA